MASKIQQEKNQILTVLSQVSQNMLMFKFKIQSTKDIIYKFCSFFSLNEEITSDLIRAIDTLEHI